MNTKSRAATQVDAVMTDNGVPYQVREFDSFEAVERYLASDNLPVGQLVVLLLSLPNKYSAVGILAAGTDQAASANNMNLPGPVENALKDVAPNAEFIRVQSAQNNRSALLAVGQFSGQGGARKTVKELWPAVLTADRVNEFTQAAKQAGSSEDSMDIDSSVTPQ